MTILCFCDLYIILICTTKDINSFRDNILKNETIPQLESISFEGIFYDYYFNTKENEIGQNEEEKEQQNEGKEDKEKELPLFYPSYMYSKSLIPLSLNTNKKAYERISNSFSYIFVIKRQTF